MTREERLAKREAQEQQKLARARQQLHQTQTARREATRKALNRRRARVGALAHEKGLFIFEDAGLAELFALLATLKDTPNPVAALAELLTDVKELVSFSCGTKESL